MIIQGLNKKLGNLIYAGIAFLLLSQGEILDVVFNLSLLIERFFTGLFIVFVVIFSNETFHKDKKSIIFQHNRISFLPYITLLLSILNMIIMIYLGYVKEVDNSQIIHIIRNIFNFSSYGIAFFWLGCYTGQVLR